MEKRWNFDIRVDQLESYWLTLWLSVTISSLSKMYWERQKFIILFTNSLVHNNKFNTIFLQLFIDNEAWISYHLANKSMTIRIDSDTT